MQIVNMELSSCPKERIGAETSGCQRGDDPIETLAAIMPRLLLQRGIGRTIARPAAFRSDSMLRTERVAPMFEASVPDTSA